MQSNETRICDQLIMSQEIGNVEHQPEVGPWEDVKEEHDQEAVARMKGEKGLSSHKCRDRDGKKDAEDGPDSKEKTVGSEGLSKEQTAKRRQRN